MIIEIDGQQILSACYNCGEFIHEGEPFMVGFDPGENNYPHEPNIAAEYYIVCEKCIRAEISDWED